MNKELIALFNRVYVNEKMTNNIPATVMDIVSLYADYGFVLDVEVLRKLKDASGFVRGAFFIESSLILKSMYVGIGFVPKAMHNDFPEVRAVSPMEASYVYNIYEIVYGKRLPWRHGAYNFDPIFGQRIEGRDVSQKQRLELRHKTAPFRMLELATVDFISNTLSDMFLTNTPWSTQETGFVTGAISLGFIPSKGIKFREKLVHIWGTVSKESYASVLNSVTDVLRLATYIGTVGKDATLKGKYKYKLTTEQSKIIMDIMEAVLKDKNTDFETDFLRHEEAWKRLAKHIRSDKYASRTPMAATALKDLRLGWMRSWASKAENLPIMARVAHISTRPGELVRRLMGLARAVLEVGEDINVLYSALEKAVPHVNCLTLLVASKAISASALVTKRFHVLPNGKILQSDKPLVSLDVVQRLWRIIDKNLSKRLHNTLEWSAAYYDSVQGVMLPTGNRAMSETNSRTYRGDYVHVDYNDKDTLRLFVHWKDTPDVDLSAVFFDAVIT